jgi:hypothetical protein
MAANTLAQATNRELTNPVLDNSLQNLSGSAFLAKLIPNIITLVLIVASIAAFFILIVGGIRWMLAAGDKAQAEGARTMITQAIIGLFIIFIVFAAMSFFGTVFGLNILDFNIESLFLK